MIPTATIDALALCFRSLSDLGAALSEEKWKTPTELPGWTVQDNLSHLVAIERMMEGLPGTPHRTDQLANVRNPIGEANEHEVDARRAHSGAEVLAEWNEISQQRLRRLRAADADYFNTPSMTPTGPGTLADFLHIRVLDCWVHELDMRRAIGLPGHLAGPAAELTVDRLLRTVPIVIGKRAATAEGESVVIDIVNPHAGDVQRHVVCEVRDGRAAMVTESERAPRCTITLDTDSFVALATGRRGPDGIAVVVEGDAEHAAKVLSQFNMMI